jgi:hypothetical protein
MRKALLPLVGLIVIGAFVAASVASASGPATGITATLKITGYRGEAMPCGSSVTLDTWITGKLNAKATGAGTANLQVNAYTGDTGEELYKVDRMAYAAVELDGTFRFVGTQAWWGNPEELGEPYDWRFELEVNNVTVWDCTVTVTVI